MAISAHTNFWTMLSLDDRSSSSASSSQTHHLMVSQGYANLPGLTYSSSSPSTSGNSSSSPMSAGANLQDASSLGDRTSRLKDSIAASLNHDSTESAQQTAMDRALAAGISRDEYERTRAGLVDMLRGRQQNGTGATSADASSEDLSQTLLSASSAQSSAKRGSSGATATNNNNNNNTRRPGASLTSISTTSTQLSDSSAPSASTLRTSVSSAAFTDVDNPSHLRHESPPTSEEEDTVGKNTSGGSREGENSFNAASAAAAALGMLAASPIKHDTRYANKQHSGSNFTAHRHVVPPSSPPMRSNSYLSSSAGANDHGYLRTSPGSRSPEPGSGSGRGKSTTPVRTRLEDIALKSSAQIRRQRERLGLKEQDEMMDLDTDARHQSSMSHLMQGSLSDNDSDGGNGGEADSSFEDAQYDPALAAASHRAPSLAAGLAPAFSLSPGRAVNSAVNGRGQAVHASGGHRRNPSYGVSSPRNQGMLDRFMEISSSPKAAATAARRSPEQQLRYAGYAPAFKEEDADDFEEDDSAHARYRTLDYARGASTPKTTTDRRAALLRSAGNDLPSPLLAQIRMLSDADYDSPAHSRSQQEAYPHMLESPRRLMDPYSAYPSEQRGGRLDASLAIPGTGSARKRKASYELMSPRGRVVNLERSASPTSSSPPPQPSFGGPSTFATSSPRWLRTSSTHPGPSHGSDNLFGGPAHPASETSQATIGSRSRHQYRSSHDYDEEQYDEPRHDAAQESVPRRSAKQEVGTSAHRPPARESKRKGKEGGSAKKQAKERLGSVTSSAGATGSATASGTSTPTLSNFTPATVRIGQYDSNTKPPFSYAALIGQAIFSAPNRRMSLADIYTYIMTLYPFYKKQDAGWQNSIRHNLSLNECFVKTQRAPDEPGKGCLWSVLPGTEEQFTGGNFYKKGKIPKPAGSERSSTTKSKKGKKAGSVASNAETMSAVSNDDSFDAASVASSSFSNSMMMVPPTLDRSAGPSRGSSSLRQQANIQAYDDEPEDDSFENEIEEEDTFDMDVPPPPMPQDLPPAPVTRSSHYQREQPRSPRYHEPPPQREFRVKQEPEYEPLQPRHKIVLRHQRMVSGNNSSLRHAIERDTTPEQEEPNYAQAPLSNGPRYDENRLAPTSEERRYSMSDRSISTEPPVQEEQPQEYEPPRQYRTQPEDLGSPVRRTRTVTAGRRGLLTSPPIMSSPPTNVFARVSQPYQPLRDAFNLPGQAANSHVAALLSSPPPSGITGDVKMRRLPPPTPRSSGLRDEDLHASSAIFLPAPNIKPGRSEFGSSRGSRVDDEQEDFEKPTLPPIHMLSPASTMPVVTQSPVSSVRASATKRSSSPSPKSNSQNSSSAGGSGGQSRSSPTLNRARIATQSSNGDIFKTPDRFGVSGHTPRISGSPAKFAHLTNSNASRALQSMQYSTPKLPHGPPGGRMAGGLVTPGGYYDPYEYSAVVDEELERMLAKNRDAEAAYRQPGDARRPLPFPSPLERTPKWQPWSPW